VDEFPDAGTSSGNLVDIISLNNKLEQKPVDNG
jgi:hypothetical protein